MRRHLAGAMSEELHLFAVGGDLCVLHHQVLGRGRLALARANPEAVFGVVVMHGGVAAVLAVLRGARSPEPTPADVVASQGMVAACASICFSVVDIVFVGAGGLRVPSAAAPSALVTAVAGQPAFMFRKCGASDGSVRRVL